MDAFLRGLAIFLEVVFLSAVIYYIIGGLRLILADFGIDAKYSRAIAMVSILAGGLLVIFFIAHLVTFYPVK